MKKLLVLALVCGAATTTWGRQPILVPPATEPVLLQPTPYSPQPTPAPGTAMPPNPGVIPGDQPALTPVPMPSPGSAPITMQPGTIVCDAALAPMVPLYSNVIVRDARNIAPCAVKKIVAVPDPCNPCCCVYVCICVPPCACESVYCSPHKDRVVFDYGQYAVKITARRDMLVVNYDD